MGVRVQLRREPRLSRLCGQCEWEAGCSPWDTFSSPTSLTRNSRTFLQAAETKAPMTWLHHLRAKEAGAGCVQEGTNSIHGKSSRQLLGFLPPELTGCGACGHGHHTWTQRGGGGEGRGSS